MHKPQNILDILSKKIPKSKLRLVPRSYDIIGGIAVVEIKNELNCYAKAIAQAIMKVHKPIETVVRKTSAMQGRYRVRKIKRIAGKKTTVTNYKEHGVMMQLDAAKVYFSVRLSNERKRIVEMVKPKENVLVFFAGVGPFALVIAKKRPNCNVIGIELNPVAAKYFKQNIEMNKLANCTAVKGDVKKLARKYANSADHILMPLPKGAENFLDVAFLTAKNGCTIHFYQFADSNRPFVKAKEKISAAAKRNKCKIRILNKKIVRPYAPDIVQVCTDFKVRKK